MKKIEDIISYDLLVELSDLTTEEIPFVANYLNSLYHEKVNTEICSYRKQICELENLIDKLENGPFNDDE